MKDSGFYILLIRLRTTSQISIGAKREASFSSGWYIYCGSSANSLTKRVLRHASSEKKKHWHIDYLLEAATLNKIWIIPDVDYELRNNTHAFSSSTDSPFECALSEQISSIEEGKKFFKGFGSGDCSCSGHLSFFKNNPEKRIVEHFRRIDKVGLVPFKF